MEASSAVGSSYPDGPAPYYSIMAPSSHEKNIEHYAALHKAASDALLELGATITHHHAVGRSFRPWYDKEIDPGFIRMMQAEKQAVNATGCSILAFFSTGLRLNSRDPIRSVALQEARMIDLYFWTTPNGYKVTIMLAELGLHYQIIPD